MDFISRLPHDIKFKLQKCNIESGETFLCDIKLKNLELTDQQIQIVKREYAHYVNISFTPVKELVENPNKWKRLSFGCNNLDECTKGGILTRGITEIFGEAGAGKTNIALQLSLMVQLPQIYGGLNKSTIYICTEQPFPFKRLFQIIETFKRKYSLINIEYSKNIFVEHITENDNLLNCVSTRMPNLMKNHGIGLIIIDSIAGIYRTETNYKNRAECMRKLASSLLHLIDTYQCAVVCINQISSVVKNDNSSDQTVPCLGIAWANLVRTRFKISKCNSNDVDDDDAQIKSSSRKKFEIIFAPDNNCGICEFSVNSEGIID